MAEGGLAALPIPDDMFDAGNEYAGGGIVAFSNGGSAGLVQIITALPEFPMLMKAKQTGVTGEDIIALENQLLEKLYARGYEMRDVQSAMQDAIESVTATPRPEQYSEGIRQDTLQSLGPSDRGMDILQAALGEGAQSTEQAAPQSEIERLRAQLGPTKNLTPEDVQQYDRLAQNIVVGRNPVRAIDKTNNLTPEDVQMMGERARMIEGNRQIEAGPVRVGEGPLKSATPFTPQPMRVKGGVADDTDDELLRLFRIIKNPKTTPEARQTAQQMVEALRTPRVDAATPIGRFGQRVAGALLPTAEERASSRATFAVSKDLDKQAEDLERRNTIFSPVSAKDYEANKAQIRQLREQAASMRNLRPQGETPAAAAAAQVPAQPAALPDAIQIGAQGTVTPDAFIPPPRQQGGAPAPRPQSGAPGVSEQQATAPAPSMGLEAIPPVAPAAPAQQGQAPAGLEELMKQRQELLGPRVEPTYLTDLATDLEKQKKQDMWATLAQLGANIAAGQSPNFLTNVGAGLASAVPSAQKSLAERRAMQRELAKAQYGEQVAERAERGEDIKFASDQLSAQAESASDREQMLRESEDKRLNRENNLRVAQTYAANAGIKQERVPEFAAMAYEYMKNDPTLTFAAAMDKVTAAYLASKPAGGGKPDASSRIFPGEDRPGVVTLPGMTADDFSR
jgi:hypothetical protein